jgi:signal-transduction protein with cAMP-binding, CBS, and nucleotidyltransferase domain
MNVGKTKVIRISRQPAPVQIIIEQKLENVGYSNCPGNIVTSNARDQSCGDFAWEEAMDLPYHTGCGVSN